ncbi:MAG: hypothetical protein LBU89_07220 [Fibromonadaceae bacterium]|jgi:hypothetical protein|nr:hypothetical protein [Fibromonadaceae bacterium]
MLKKLIVASAVLALFFACSSDDGGDPPKGGETSSSSEGNGGNNGGNSSSSSLDTPEPVISEIFISRFRTATAAINAEPFKTYPYSYTQRGGVDEDLRQFWNVHLEECPIRGAVEDDAKAPDLATCQVEDRSDAVLQNTLTNRYSPLRYKIDGVSLGYPEQGIEMKEYNLKGTGDQAALGLNVDIAEPPVKNIGELGNKEIDGTIAFLVKYRGGAHEFRIVSKEDGDFWYYEIPASTEIITIEIPVGELKGMGTFISEDDVVKPFNVEEIAKFLWVVEYKDDNPGYNTGTLLIDDLLVKVKR